MKKKRYDQLKGAHFGHNGQVSKVQEKVHKGMCCNNPGKR